MKKTSKHDAFDLDTCKGGLGLALVDIYSRLMEYCYYLTFKKEMKDYAKEFNDPDTMPIEDSFYESITDPSVKLCFQTYKMVFQYFEDYKLRSGLHNIELLENEDFGIEASRYLPIYAGYFKMKSYRKTRLYYERCLEAVSHTLYYYCCALTLNTYLIPLKMRVNLDYTEHGSFRYLNIDNHEVFSLTELITSLEEKRMVLKTLR